MQVSPNPPELAFMCRAFVQVAEACEVGLTPLGRRRIIDILGGRVEGPLLTGVILPGGADWQVVREDGTAVLEARYTIRTDDGALIYVRNDGYRHGPADVMAALARGESVDPALYYFRTTPRFETGAPRFAWLNRTLALCSGVREKAQVILDFFVVK
jgi:hypothetical protein